MDAPAYLQRSSIFRPQTADDNGQDTSEEGVVSQGDQGFEVAPGIDVTLFASGRLPSARGPLPVTSKAVSCPITKTAGAATTGLPNYLAGSPESSYHNDVQLHSIPATMDNLVPDQLFSLLSSGPVNSRNGMAGTSQQLEVPSTQTLQTHIGGSSNHDLPLRSTPAPQVVNGSCMSNIPSFIPVSVSPVLPAENQYSSPVDITGMINNVSTGSPVGVTDFSNFVNGYLQASQVSEDAQWSSSADFSGFDSVDPHRVNVTPQLPEFSMWNSSGSSLVPVPVGSSGSARTETTHSSLPASLAWDSYDPLLSLYSPSSGTPYSSDDLRGNEHSPEGGLGNTNRPLTRAQRRLLFPDEPVDRILGILNPALP